MTWYNIFLHYNEERTCCHKLLSPFVLLFYPIWIVPVTLGLCLYGGIRCISWYWDSYWNEITNPDSGFCHWICEQLNLPDCSPYQVVLLSADSENGGSPAQPSPQNVWKEKLTPIQDKYYYDIIIYCSYYYYCYLLMDLVRKKKVTTTRNRQLLFYQNWASRQGMICLFKMLLLRRRLGFFKTLV